MSNGAAAPGRPRAGARRAAAGRLPQSSDRPPYRLVADDLRRQILVGRLAPGEQVPPSRTLQEDYGIANMTARSAVRVLRDEGLVHTEPGRGTFVAHSLPAPAGAAPEAAAWTHMPTGEYTDLAAPHRRTRRRPRHLATPPRTGRQPPPADGHARHVTGGGPRHHARPGGVIRVALAQEAPTAAAGYGEAEHAALLHRLVQEAEFVPPDLSQ
ncbi:winged helix-turn-helix domain-containing protein [Streptomyces sp. NPDC020766]|uniref:GntR family transcriptional regulator n=1 Tax=Streptomyces sp. NPDC020766 TaxID=3155011 RepID=UPI0033CB1F93